MNVFVESIVKYDKTVKVPSMHGIMMNPPLPLGSSIKISRCYLDDDSHPTDAIFAQLRREVFIDCRMQPWSKDGVFVHVIAAPPIIIPPNTKRRKLWLHLVKKELFHLIDFQEEYEWWQLTDQEKELLDKKLLM